MCDMTHSHVWHDSLKCVTCLIEMCTMTHSRARQVLFTCAIWLTLGGAPCISEWPRLIKCLKLQVIFRKRATIYRALWRKMTCKDKASYGSSPPCIANPVSQSGLRTKGVRPLADTPSKLRMGPQRALAHGSTSKSGGCTGMGWLRLVGSSKLQVSFAEYSLSYRALSHKRPTILRSLLIVATP